MIVPLLAQEVIMSSFAPLAAAVVLASVALAGCPERQDAIDTAGHAAQAQVDDAKARIGRAEDKMQAATDAAAKIPE